MKLHRLAKIPFALMGDLLTLGQMGEGSFTQELFENERREQEASRFLEEIKTLLELAKMIKKK